MPRFHLAMRPSLIVTSALVLVFGATTFGPAHSTPATPAPAIGIGRQILQHERMRDANDAYGVVTYFKRFDMQIQSGPNAYRTIHLHQGTVVSPRGATPAVGKTVAVTGYGRPDGSLEAIRITIER